MAPQQEDGDCRRDDYWKLKYPRRIDSRDLQDYARDVPSTLGKPSRARDLVSRKLRGLLAYERCTVAELRRFGKQRNLILGGRRCGEGQGVEQQMSAHENTKTRRREKRSLVALLEYADDKQKFEWFLDLPPELRALVYEFHFAWLEDSNRGSLVSRKAPPITEVSSLPRRETLGLFYHSCAFQLELEGIRTRTEPYRWTVSSETSYFFRMAPREHVQMVRHIELSCKVLLGDRYPIVPAIFKIDLGTGKIPNSIKVLCGYNAMIIKSFAVEISERLISMREQVNLNTTDLAGLFILLESAFKSSVDGISLLT